MRDLQGTTSLQSTVSLAWRQLAAARTCRVTFTVCTFINDSWTSSCNSRAINTNIDWLLTSEHTKIVNMHCHDMFMVYLRYYKSFLPSQLGTDTNLISGDIFISFWVRLFHHFNSVPTYLVNLFHLGIATKWSTRSSAGIQHNEFGMSNIVTAIHLRSLF